MGHIIYYKYIFISIKVKKKTSREHNKKNNASIQKKDNMRIDT